MKEKEDKKELPQHLKYKMFPPSDTLSEKMEEMAISIQDLARLSGLDETTVRDILENKIKVDEKIAICLEKATTISVNYWLRDQRFYDEYVEYKKKKSKEVDLIKK